MFKLEEKALLGCWIGEKGIMGCRWSLCINIYLDLYKIPTKHRQAVYQTDVLNKTSRLKIIKTYRIHVFDC